MIEDIKTTSYSIPEELFKPKELYQVKFYLDDHKEIDPNVIFDLAIQIQKNKRLEILYRTYHNFFSLNKERSERELVGLIRRYQKDQELLQVESDEFKERIIKLRLQRSF